MYQPQPYWPSYHNISYLNVRFSFVDLRWAQLYISLVASWFGDHNIVYVDLRRKRRGCRQGVVGRVVIILRQRGDYLVGYSNYLPIDPRQDSRQHTSEGCIVACIGGKQFSAHFKTYLCIPGITAFLTKAPTWTSLAFEPVGQSSGGMHRYGNSLVTSPSSPHPPFSVQYALSKR